MNTLTLIVVITTVIWLTFGAALVAFHCTSGARNKAPVYMPPVASSTTVTPRTKEQLAAETRTTLRLAAARRQLRKG
jgi:hypothetical protein